MCTKRKDRSRSNESQMAFSFDSTTKIALVTDVFPPEDESCDATRLRGGRDADLEKLGSDLLLAAGCPKAAARLQVVWNPRLGSTAGTANFVKCCVNLNPWLLHIAPEEVDRTFRHELAHLATYERHPSPRTSAHGPEWRRACCDMGIPGESRTHAIMLPSRNLRPKFLYECAHCGKHYPKVRKLKRRYACTICCSAYSRGKFDARFELQRISMRES